MKPRLLFFRGGLVATVLSHVCTSGVFQLWVIIRYEVGGQFPLPVGITVSVTRVGGSGIGAGDVVVEPDGVPVDFGFSECVLRPQ